jgi:hypothetical protein
MRNGRVACHATSLSLVEPEGTAGQANAKLTPPISPPTSQPRPNCGDSRWAIFTPPEVTSKPSPRKHSQKASLGKHSRKAGQGTDLPAFLSIVSAKSNIEEFIRLRHVGTLRLILKTPPSRTIWCICCKRSTCRRKSDVNQRAWAESLPAGGASYALEEWRGTLCALSTRRHCVIKATQLHIMVLILLWVGGGACDVQRNAAGLCRLY